MPRSTNLSNPYQKFDTTQKRCIGLINLYIDLRKEGRANSDLLRSAVVLSVASMDAYFTDKFCDLVIPVIRQSGAGDTLVQLLADAGLDTHQALGLLTMDRPYRRIRTLVTRHLERTVTQRLDAIDRLFICLGIEEFCDKIEGRSGRRNLLRRMELLVNRRHAIVHDGDYNRHRRLRSIDPYGTIKHLRDMYFFVSEAEDFLNTIVS